LLAENSNSVKIGITLKNKELTKIKFGQFLIELRQKIFVGACEVFKHTVIIVELQVHSSDGV